MSNRYYRLPVDIELEVYPHDEDEDAFNLVLYTKDEEHEFIASIPIDQDTPFLGDLNTRWLIDKTIEFEERNHIEY